MPIDINLKTISKAKLDARTKRVNLTDTRGRGLVLRGGPLGLTWQFRKQIDGKPRRLIIGAVDRWTIAEARQIADAADDHVATFGTMVDGAWLQSHLVVAGKIEAPASAADDFGSFPTFAQGRSEYLAAVAGHLKPATIASYRGFLEHPLVRALDDRRLPSITLDDVREIVIAIAAGGHERTAELVASAIRPMFNHLAEAGRRKRFGVMPGVMTELQAPPRKYTDDDFEDDSTPDDPWSDGYVPEISELGRIIAVARSGLMTPITGAAVELTCWTVQRRTTIARARIRDFVDLKNGTGLWNIPSGSRKGVRKGKKARPHTIPLPAPAWQCVERALAAALKRDPEARYLFPAARPRRIGDKVTHMHPSTLTHRFLDIPGCGASPHDVRRTMGTHGENLLGFSRVDTGTLMDHADSQKESDRIMSRTAGTGTDSITGIYYSLSDGTHHTWPTMRIWCEAVAKAVEEATANMESMDQLAQGYGNRNSRVGVGARLVPTGVKTADERAAEEVVFQRKLARLGGGEYVPDDEDENA